MSIREGGVVTELDGRVVVAGVDDIVPPYRPGHEDALRRRLPVP